MNTRVLATGLIILSAALAACGGGGGSGGGGGVLPTPTPTPVGTPTPTPVPTLNPNGCAPSPAAVQRQTLSTSPRPIGSGDSFTFTGNYLQTVVRFAPCPEPTATSAATLGTTVTDTATTAPNAQPGVTSQSIETAAFPTNTLTTTTNALLQENATQALMYSTTSTDSNGNTVSTTFSNPQVIDELPETAGQQWTNNPAQTVKETFADGTSSMRTVNADGTYAETDNGASGLTAQIQTHADGSGTYNVYGNFSLSYAAPSGNQIVVTIGTPAPAPAPTPKTRIIPQWFTTPVNLYSDSFADNGLQTFDPACHVPSSVTTATQGDQIVETLSITDPVLGYAETRKTTSYDVAGIGQVCIVLADTVNSYYDYNFDTFRLDYQTTDGNPLQTDTIAEAMWQSGAPTVFSVRRQATARGISPDFVAARVIAIDHYRAVQRMQRVRALERFFSSYARTGGVR